MPSKKKYRKRNTGTLGRKKVRGKKLKNLQMSDHYHNGKYYDWKVNTPSRLSRAVWNQKKRWQRTM